MAREPLATNHQMNIAKGIGIIMVVIGHSNPPEFLINMVNLFHLPLFYFISGYFFQDKYCEAPLTFVGKRIVSLYIPFLQYSLFFLVLRNYFFDIHFYSDQTIQLGQQLKPYVARDFWGHAWTLIRFRETELLLGPLWFLTSLFVTTMIFIVISIVNRKFFESNEFSRFVMLLVIFVAAFVIIHQNIMLPRIFPPYLTVSSVAVFFYYLGFLEKKYGVGMAVPAKYIPLIVLVLLATSFLYPPISMGERKFNSMQFLLVNSGLGIIAVLHCSNMICEKRIHRLLEYLGGKSLTIFALHLVSFKIVSLLIIIWYGFPIDRLASFPVISDKSQWWAIYTIVGLGVPLVWAIMAEYLGKQVRLFVKVFHA